MQQLPTLTPCRRNVRLHKSADEAVQETNDDAALSKASAVRRGYLDDAFITKFMKKDARRPPIINRGTFVRTHAIDVLVEQFHETCRSQDAHAQIVSLGAGFDTRYFNLKKRGRSFKTYVEVDLSEIVERKMAVIQQHSELTDIIGERQDVDSGLRGNDYVLMKGDLRHWKTVAEALSHILDFDSPILFLSECVLIYLNTHDSDTIVDWISQHCLHAAFVLYEQILPDDPFGQVMIDNLRQRHIELKSIWTYPTLQSQIDRFMSREWSKAFALTISEIHDRVLTPEIRTRISRLELFDEVEEWTLLGNHYCVCWATKGRMDDMKGLQVHRKRGQKEDIVPFTLWPQSDGASVKLGSPERK
ncbi:hypothetical protein BZG36_04344 [Bifiguratus adelaidae]|uniref:Leucine carboxyl methyltransferase 1 n=1 Tax=Bifiguratus adelaidae TaxID=1938954 RepID=A0A261XWS3_9FUNG|nr:hypothetical protein BZG36_04344 [Bifiguratus adelaidae]